MRTSRTGWQARALSIAALAITATAAAAADSPAAAPAASADVDPAAMAALDSMSAYLQTLTAFQVQAVTQREVVLENGIKAQYGGVASVLARKPNGLRAELTSDRQERQFIYDGKEFTLFAPRLGFYATVAAPPTIRALVTTLEERFDIEFPLVDLFRWGTADSSTKSVTVAMDLGPGAVDGTTCEHYAFRQDGLDWQVWIQKGQYPLPRKLVLTTTTDEARPQFQATYTWNLAPSFNDAAFAFDPPAGAHRITLNEHPAAAGDSK